MDIQHKVPIHLDQEDKFLLSMSARQTLVIGIGITFGYIIASDFDFSQGWGFAIGVSLFVACVVLSLAVAFIRLKTRDLDQWFLVWIAYISRPRYYLHRPLEQDSDERDDLVLHEEKVEVEEW